MKNSKIVLRIKKLFYQIDTTLLKVPCIGKRRYLRQFTRFVIAGGIFTVVDFAVYIILTRAFFFWQTRYLLANFVSMAVAATGSFFVNKIWTFKDHEKKLFIKYIKFWIIVGIGIGMYQLLFFIFAEYISLYDLIAKALAAFIVTFGRFIAQKFWIFK